MHTFQPYPFDVIEINPFQKFGKDWGALTTEKDGKVNTMTIGWGGVGVLWGKNVCTVYVRESRFTRELMDEDDNFSVTFFEDKYRNSLRYLGAVSGRQEDKLASARLNVNYNHGVPFVDEGNFAIICKTLSSTLITPDDIRDESLRKQFYADGDYHIMYVGEIVELLAR